MSKIQMSSNMKTDVSAADASARADARKSAMDEAANVKRMSAALGVDDILVEPSADWADAPYQSGFSLRTVIGAFFIGFVMLPGIIYMGLVVGANIGSGAQWVTVLLFLELARRSYQKVSRQELMIINHMASSLTGMAGGIMLSGGVFAQLVWQQYLKRSEAFHSFNLTDQMPKWFSPPPEVLLDRTFLMQAWVPAIIVAVLAMLLQRVQFFGLGYLLFRITADVERLPFPMARVGAEGSTALAEAGEDRKESWRWSVFSILAIVGVVWGVIYMGIPSLSSVLFGSRVSLIPIPFMDLTSYTESFMPSAAIAITFDLGLMLAAFVIPWRVVVGGAVTCILCQVLLPPVFYKLGIHKQWQPGFGALDTQIANSLDVWMSVGIGAAISVALTGIWFAVKASRSSGRKGGAFDWKALKSPPTGRGDYSFALAVLLFLLAGAGFVLLVHGTVNLGWLGGMAKPRKEWFPLWILIVFAFAWTPVNSYINAKLSGIGGQSVSLPFVREGSFLLSGYRHPDIWMAPIPLHDFSYAATLFKQLELTRVNFRSLVKVEILSATVLTVAGLIYWSYIWHLGPVPSDEFPFAREMWPYLAKNTALWVSALGEGNNQVLSAIRPDLVLGSAAGFTVLFAVFGWLGIPAAFYYGAVGGVGQFPHVAITMLLGLALRFAVARRLGADNLRQYAPVMLTGFVAGFGIAGMIIVGVVLLKTAITALAY